MEEYKNHPGVAAVLSFVFNGLGQLYNGEIKKGLWIIFLSSSSMVVLILGAMLIALNISWPVFFTPASIAGLVLFSFGSIAICIIGILSISDAYNKAKGK